ncbi:MAG: FtsQ-type POTRA domain-containing protein [Candidatus Moranbacteria bacterium]|nr:FtsQ-type POTRA domain-containing protein [Candidatus Moranbacteria bacterium]
MSLFKKKEKNKFWKRSNPRMYSGVPGRTAEKRALTLARFFYWLLFIVFLSVSFYIFFLSPFLQIDAISVEGNESISAEDIKKSASEALQGNYFKYFSKNNFFLGKNDEVSRKLKNDFNRIGKIEIQKKFPKTMLIKIDERQAELVWCSSGVCYLVDEDGLVYSGANATDEELKKSGFLTVIDDNARQVEIEKTVISKDFISYLKELNYVLREELQLEPDGTYHTPALASGEVYFQTKEGWMLKLSDQISPAETKKIIQTLFEKELGTEKRQNLDYLDLRIKGKVYYKLKTESEK